MSGFKETGYLEDVDYSYRVGRKYRLAVVAEAGVDHLSGSITGRKNFLLGKWQVMNRLIVLMVFPRTGLTQSGPAPY